MRRVVTPAVALSALWFLVCTTAAAQDDPIRKLQLDQRAAKIFAERAAKSVVVIDGTIAPPDWADQRTPGPRVSALAVAVRHASGRVALLTGGVFGAGVTNVSVRNPSGKPIAVTAIQPLGDGGLVELVIAAKALKAIKPLTIFENLDIQNGMPVLSVNGVESKSPTLFFGVILEQLAPPLSHIYTTDIKFPHGAPLLAADGRLVGITFRNQPNEDDIGWAIGADSLDAWLRPEGPPEDTGKAPVPTR